MAAVDHVLCSALGLQSPARLTQSLLVGLAVTRVSPVVDPAPTQSVVSAMGQGREEVLGQRCLRN